MKLIPLTSSSAQALLPELHRDWHGGHTELRACTGRLSNPRSCPHGTSCSCPSPRYSEFTAQLGARGKQAPEENKRVKKKNIKKYL